MRLLCFVGFILLCNAIDLTLWKTFFDQCFIGADEFLDDGAFCTDFKVNHLTEYAAIEEQDDLGVTPADASTKEKTAGGDISRSSSLLETQDQLVRRHPHHHHHRHRHFRGNSDLQSEHFAMSRDPIGNKWPRANVYYQIATATDATLSVAALKESMAERVFKAMELWSLQTCIDFIPAADATNGLTIISDDSEDKCMVDNPTNKNVLGFPGNGNKLVMRLQAPGGRSWDQGCPPGTVVHEFGHVYGLYHTHTRADRNTYCNVKPDNELSDPKWIPEYAVKSGTGNIVDEPLVGTKQEKADEFYNSLMLYAFDSDMGIATGWAENPLQLTPNELSLKALWTRAAGQRKKIGTLDARTVNNQYGCFAVNVKDVGANAASTVFTHPDQSIGLLVSRLSKYFKRSATSFTLWTNDNLQQEHTAQPLTTLLSALTTPITSQSTVTAVFTTTKITFTDSETHVVHVELSWTLQRVLDMVKYFYNIDWTAKTISKGQTQLTKSSTLTALQVADNDALTVS